MSIFPTTCPNGDCPGWRVTFPAGTARDVCPWSGDPLEVAEHTGVSPWGDTEGRAVMTLPIQADLVDRITAGDLAALIAAADAAVAAYLTTVTA